jgi:hypothetical protein
MQRRTLLLLPLCYNRFLIHCVKCLVTPKCLRLGGGGGVQTMSTTIRGGRGGGGRRVEEDAAVWRMSTVEIAPATTAMPLSTSRRASSPGRPRTSSSTAASLIPSRLPSRRRPSTTTMADADRPTRMGISMPRRRFTYLGALSPHPHDVGWRGEDVGIEDRRDLDDGRRDLDDGQGRIDEGGGARVPSTIYRATSQRTSWIGRRMAARRRKGRRMEGSNSKHGGMTRGRS